MTNSLQFSAFIGSLVLLGAATPGCAADTSDPSAAPEADESDITALRYYDCHGSNDNDTLTHIELGVSKTKAKITDLSKDATEPDTGTVDHDYKPTSTTYKGSTRYLGFDKVADGLSSDVSRVDVMVSEEITSKAKTGRMWIRTSGPEGAATDSLVCNAKPKALAVDLATKGRFLCDMTPLVCGAGAPPGETCLDALFITESAGGNATLRLTWYDHFGVFAKERKETIGASSAFTRTKTGLHGKWAGHTLDLDYRAGITYLGKVKLPSGKSAPVKCSDLAMLD